MRGEKQTFVLPSNSADSWAGPRKTGESMDIQNCWDDVSAVLGAGVDRLILFGPPGTGKTHAALHLGVSGEVERLICTEDITSAEVTGSYVPNGEGGWRWHDGPAIRAWRAGRRFVVDEVDRASGDVLSLLLAMTDTNGSAQWHHPITGEVVHPAPGYSVVMTTNLEEMALLPPALRDRFPVAIRIDRPHRDALATLSSDLRAAAAQGSLGDVSRRISLRSFYAFDRLRGELGASRAATLLFGDRAHDFLDAIRIGTVTP